MPSRLRIAVVDDHPIFREGIAQALCSTEDLELVAEGSSAEEAIKIAEHHLPDILLLDINMPGCGLNAARTIARQYPHIKLMMLTVSESEEHVESAIEAGAHAYMLKGISGPEFLRSVRAIQHGGHTMAPEVATRLLAKAAHMSTSFDSRFELPTLTPREQEILRLLADSLSNEEIAELMNLTEKIVSDYIGNIIQKMHLRARVESALHGNCH